MSILINLDLNHKKGPNGPF